MFKDKEYTNLVGCLVWCFLDYVCINLGVPMYVQICVTIFLIAME